MAAPEGNLVGGGGGTLGVVFQFIALEGSDLIGGESWHLIFFGQQIDKAPILLGMLFADVG